MTLGKALKAYGKEHVVIEYRTYSSGLNVFAGMCEYKNGELISSDGDSYSLQDELINWEAPGCRNGIPLMIVWY